MNSPVSKNAMRMLELKIEENVLLTLSRTGISHIYGTKRANMVWKEYHCDNSILNDLK